jgi:hypothetical protein
MVIVIRGKWDINLSGYFIIIRKLKIRHIVPFNIIKYSFDIYQKLFGDDDAVINIKKLRNNE